MLWASDIPSAIMGFCSHASFTMQFCIAYQYTSIVCRTFVFQGTFVKATSSTTIKGQSLKVYRSMMTVMMMMMRTVHEPVKGTDILLLDLETTNILRYKH